MVYPYASFLGWVGGGGIIHTNKGIYTPALVQKIAVDETTLLIFLWIIQEHVNMECFICVNSYSSLLEQEKVLSIQYDISKNKKRLQISQE